MFLNAAVILTALILIQVAGYFFKLNQNLLKGACTLTVMVGIVFGIQASRDEALKERSAAGNPVPLHSSRP